MSVHLLIAHPSTLCSIIVIKLIPHIVVPVDALRHLDIHQCLRLLAGQSRLVGVPESAAERAGHIALGLGHCPELETLVMNVVSTSSLTPSDLVALWVKRYAADGTVIFDRLAVVAAFVVGRSLFHSCRQSGRVLGDFFQLGSEESVLVAEALRRFEDVVQDVERMFSQSLVGVVALEGRVWAAARRDVRDDDCVDVASRSGDLESVDGAVFVARVAVFFRALRALQHVHALGGSTLEQGVVRLVRVGDVSVGGVSTFNRTCGLQGRCTHFLSLTSGCPGPRRGIRAVLRSQRSSKFSARMAERLKDLLFASFSLGGTS